MRLLIYFAMLSILNGADPTSPFQYLSTLKDKKILHQISNKLDIKQEKIIIKELFLSIKTSELRYLEWSLPNSGKKSLETDLISIDHDFDDGEIINSKGTFFFNSNDKKWNPVLNAKPFASFDSLSFIRLRDVPSIAALYQGYQVEYARRFADDKNRQIEIVNSKIGQIEDPKDQYVEHIRDGDNKIIYTYKLDDNKIINQVQGVMNDSNVIFLLQNTFIPEHSFEILNKNISSTPAFIANNKLPQSSLQKGLIGVQVKKKGDNAIITQVFPDSPAFKAGLKPDYRILKINDIDVKPLSQDIILQLIRSSTPLIITFIDTSNHVGKTTIEKAAFVSMPMK